MRAPLPWAAPCAGVVFTCFVVCATGQAVGHDTWVETNAALVRAGDRVEIDLKLGNHGNNHRDFKLAGKQSLEGLSLEVVSPAGKRFDLKAELADLGYAPKEGYWSASLITSEAGHYTAVASSDRIVNHGAPQRSVRSAKTVWLASKSLDKPTAQGKAYQQPLGLPCELVLLSDPVLFAGPGNPIQVQLLKQGQPVVGNVVSFVPRGVDLAEGFDETYERRTDKDGKASFTPKAGNVYLIVSHVLAKDEKGADYEDTKYAATLTLRVPQICPCCDE
jgi:uncharacterized GH25 family protein